MEVRLSDRLTKMDKYPPICEIGKGACGAVYLTRNKDNNKLYALKKIQLDESRKTRTKEAVLREARILSDLKHPHIVAYHDSFFDENEAHLFIVQDYCDGGTLDDKIKEASQKKQYLQEKEIIQWFIQLALAVRYMHSKRVLHRDLKTQNVFLNKGGTLCKLGDFGIAKSMDTTIDVASTCVGTPCYLSPEMCQDIPYSSKADIWALGCMLYEMVALKPAFDAFNLVSLFYKIVQGEYNPIPDCYSEGMADLVQFILTKLPEDRPSARGVLLMPYVKQHLLQFIEEKEFILKERRAPTRQGSRPYSTPTHRPSFLEKASYVDNEKRAISCRPSLNIRQEKFLGSAKSTTHSGRVSTIPEETEEQLLEKSRLQEKQKLAIDRLELAGISESNSPTVKIGKDANSNNIKEESPVSDAPSSHSLEDGAPKEVLTSRSDKSDHSSKSDKSEKSDRSSTKSDPSSRSTKSAKGTRVVKSAKSTRSSKSARTRVKSGEKSQESIDKEGKVKERKVEAEENGSDTEIMTCKEVKSDKNQRPKELKLDIQVKEARHASSVSRDSPVSELVKVDSPRLAKINLGSSHTPDIEPPKRKPIQLQRTPRIQEPNALIIQMDPPRTGPNLIVTNHRPERTFKEEAPRLPPIPDVNDPAESVATFIEDDQSSQTFSAVPVNKLSAGLAVQRKASKGSGRSRKTESGKRYRISAGRKSSNRSKSGQTYSGRPTTRESSAISIPEEPDDYYSDDFVEDENSSGSLTDDDIPEELEKKSYSSRALSNTQTFEMGIDLDEEIPEIEEELPDGEMAADEDAYGNDFDDDEIEEELDDVVTVAKAAHSDLEKSKVIDEDIVYSQRQGNTSQFIRDHCMDALGKEKYEKVKAYCEKNGAPEMRRLEKIVGKEYAKTAYLMTSIIKPPNHVKTKK